LSFDGTDWGADAYFSGSTQVRNQSWAVEGTDNDALYQTYRFGADFSYAIPIANGDYKVTLQFVETWWTSAGQRRFDVHLEGEERISGLDLFAAAGGRYIAHDIMLPVSVQDGVLNIDFRGQANAADKNALISGIVIEGSEGSGGADLFDLASAWHDGGDAFGDYSSPLGGSLAEPDLLLA
ncbi:MAG: hypothetical protein EA406_10485, partial [Rhodospirillales bacterium]